MLGRWVSKERKVYRKNTEENTTCTLTAEHIRALNGIGFDWGTSWNERFEQLREFKAQFGHYNVPQKYSANPKLGNWVANQRINYRKNTEGKLSPMAAEHIRALDGIGAGVDWKTSQRGKESNNWNERFEQLREFKAQFGHCTVPTRYPANPKLGRWVMTQRGTYRKNKEGRPSPMTAERIQALNAIGFECENTAVFGIEQSVV